MRIVPAVVLLLIFIGCSGLQRYEWSNNDKLIFSVAMVANMYDGVTTSNLIHDGGYIESPWHMLYFGDDTPSDALLFGSKIAQGMLAYKVLDYVHPNWRRIVLFGMTGTWVWYGSNN